MPSSKMTHCSINCTPRTLKTQALAGERLYSRRWPRESNAISGKELWRGTSSIWSSQRPFYKMWVWRLWERSEKNLKSTGNTGIFTMHGLSGEWLRKFHGKTAKMDTKHKPNTFDLKWAWWLLTETCYSKSKTLSSLMAQMDQFG